MIDRMDLTVVAIASAPGAGPLGIVRMSGPDAITIADKTAVLEGQDPLSQLRSWTRITGRVALEPSLTLPAAFYIFRKPQSYTRQNLVEIQTVGSPSVLDWLRRRLIELGATPAQPGEFTARAFLNGAMDLCEAEAVGATIAAENDTQLRAARQMKGRSLNRWVSETRTELVELLALVEADIDFAEEPIDFISPADAARRMEKLRVRLDDWLKQSVATDQLGKLPRILLLGAPNVGKSSLLNRMSGIDRAICAAVAGTTRDILSAPIRLDRGEAILLDTAGIEESQDEIRRLASGKAVEAADAVDLVCVVADITRLGADRSLEPYGSLDRERVIVALNKCDLVSSSDMEVALVQLQAIWGCQIIPISAAMGTGIDSLRSSFAQNLGMTSVFQNATWVTDHQRAGLIAAREALIRGTAHCHNATATIDAADVLAFELREALDRLAEVTGAVTTDELLHHVFANFCIGK